MKVLTRAQEEDHYQAVIKGGTQAGAVGLTAASAAAFVANRSWPAFRNLTLPLKAFAVTSLTTFSLIIGADRASRSYEDRQLDSHDDQGWTDVELEHRLGFDTPHPSYDSLSPRDKFFAQLKENQFKIVLGGWAASMVGSFGLVAAQPMSLTQKLIQARMYAQSLTVAMIIASAGLASFAASEPKELTSEQDPRTSSIYKFKKGSPHELREQERRDARIRQS